MDGHQADIFLNRHQRVRQAMQEQGIDFLYITPSSDLLYLLGYPAHASERLTLLGIPADGEPFVVVPRLEAPRLEHWRDKIDVHAWEETESPYDLVAKLSEGAANQKIGISDFARASVLLEFLERMPEAAFQSATPVLRELRIIKDEWEIEQQRIASELTDQAWEEFISTAKLTGRSETDIAAELTGLMRKRGFARMTFIIVASGPGSASPHHMTGDRIVQEGDSIVFDFGAPWNHYTSDLTRTVHIGEPSNEYRHAYETVLKANEAAFQAVRPGVACEDIDRAARDVITEAGYGEYFIHRVGHGLGLDGHEEPYLVGGNKTPLRPGMVFSDEPGIYIPGKFGIRIEDTVVCREDGGERLNHCRRELTIME
jgi:Xaa-Pro aminopeptidase